MNPARIVAVTRLMLDILRDLADQDIDTLSEAEAEFACLLIPFAKDLQAVHATALQDMNALAPKLLAQTNPAPG